VEVEAMARDGTERKKREEGGGREREGGKEGRRKVASFEIPSPPKKLCSLCRVELSERGVQTFL